MESGGAGEKSPGERPPEGRPATIGSPLTDAASGAETSSPADPDLAAQARALEQTIGASGGSRSGIGSLGRLSGIGPLLPIGSGVVFAVLWFLIGGLPFADHDEYGVVVVERPDQQQQQAVVDLPDGERYIYYEESGLGENESADQPPGLEVLLQPVEGRKRLGEPLEIESVPGFLFSAQTDDTGWEPYGKVEVDQGRYALDAVAPNAFGRVTIGNPPINPFGPPIVGSILILVLGAGLTGLIKGWFRRS